MPCGEIRGGKWRAKTQEVLSFLLALVMCEIRPRASVVILVVSSTCDLHFHVVVVRNNKQLQLLLTVFLHNMVLILRMIIVNVISPAEWVLFYLFLRCHFFKFLIRVSL